ncbi:hypothetical protein BVI061214_00223 [Thermus aquaticus]|jgi:hypothetical protein|uniref:Uncharacterized protein n=1 Tax=Thermus aquaticus TaxID=271 RepID=A0A0N0BL52_THEAQ|nr:hypothetical protein BVI061214_00223 [Thermus aquaticus]
MILPGSRNNQGVAGPVARLEVGPSPYHLPILAPALLRVLVVRRFRP